MGRSVNQNLLNLLQSGAHYDTVQISLSSGAQKKISHADLSQQLGGSWLAHFGEVTYIAADGEQSKEVCAVGATAQTLGAEVDRVDVTIQNVDTAIGTDVVSAARTLRFATAATGKFLFDHLNPANFEHRILFDGIVAATNATERVGKISIISDRVAAGDALATKTLSPRNGFTYNDTSLPVPPSSSGGGRGTGDGNPCFVGETLILTTGGEIPIRELVEEFERKRTFRWQVYCFDPLTRLVYKTEVKQAFRHSVPRSQILNYELHHAARLGVTPTHGIETALGKRAAGKLTAEDVLFAPDLLRGKLTASGIYGFSWQAGNDSVEVFNFEAAIWHTYFANRTAVYNSKLPTDYGYGYGQYL